MKLFGRPDSFLIYLNIVEVETIYTYSIWWISRLKDRSSLSSDLPCVKFYVESYEPKTFHLGLIDREIFAEKSPKT